jgi:hypothetical protein
VLLLSNNHLTHIPEQLSRLPFLRVLFVDNNPINIEFPEPSPLTTPFPSLEILTIGNRTDNVYPQLSEVPVEQFRRLPHIERVIVRGTKPHIYCPDAYQMDNDRVLVWHDSLESPAMQALRKTLAISGQIIVPENGYDVEPVLF